jgi:hypothetical protein
MAAGLILAATLSYLIWNWLWLPPLARDLPEANFGKAQAVFRDRVRSKFVVGMDESELIKELRLQGFSSPVGQYGTKEAKFSQSRIICFLTWAVRWSTDGKGKIKNIDGDFNYTCI